MSRSHLLNIDPEVPIINTERDFDKIGFGNL